jgi:two-component system, LytTR family, response regulator
MKLSCMVVEDEPLARNLLVDYISKVPYLNLVETFSDPLKAMDALRNTSVDLLFLDIQMPQLTGISLLKSLRNKPLVIFTTAYSEYALEGYDLDVVDYLLKPITFERFLKAVDKANQRLTQPSAPQAVLNLAEQQQPFVFVKDGTKLVKIRWEDILYVEGLKDYVTIHTHQQKIVTLQRLKSLEEQLPADKFIRIHHSYIVAVAAIEVINKGEVQIGKAFLPISETYKKTFKEFIDKNQMQ